MKKYSFSMTKKEIEEFRVRVILEEIRYQFATWLLIGILVLAYCVWKFFWESEVRELADWVMEIMAIRWIGIILAVFIFGLIIVMICRRGYLIKNNLYGKAWTMGLEDTLLKVEDGEVCRDTPCINVRVTKKKRNLIMLGVYHGEEHLSWYYIPLRAFSDEQEMLEFLKKIQFSKELYIQKMRLEAAYNQKVYSKNLFGIRFEYKKSDGSGLYYMPSDDKEYTCERGIYHFTFWIDEERWKRALIETKDIIRSGILGNYKKNKVILAVFGVDLVIFICGCIFNIDYKLLLLVFLTLLFMLHLVSNNMVNPEKVVKRKWKEGLMKSGDYGKWKVSVSEKGITCDKSNRGRTTISWKKYSNMVETDTAFYLFGTDKKHFIMILKECIENYEQAEGLKWLCMDNNIAVTMSKKVRYVPYWVFTLLLAVLILIFLLYSAWLGLR